MQNNAFTRLTLLIVYNFNCRIKICNSVYGFCLILYFNSAKFLGQFTRFSELIYVVTCWPEITSSQKGNIWSILISTVYHLANWITVQNYQSWPISAEIIWLVADIYAFEGTSLVLPWQGPPSVRLQTYSETPHKMNDTLSLDFDIVLNE